MSIPLLKNPESQPYMSDDIEKAIQVYPLNRDHYLYVEV